MIGVDRFASVFGGAPAHTAEHLTEHLRAVIRSGYSPVLCKPGTKEPVCPLSAAQAKKADRERQQMALAMNPAARVDRIRHECGLKHVLDDPAKIGPIVKRLVEIHGSINVALHLGRARMLVVDVDTPAERQAFINAMGDAAGVGYGPHGPVDAVFPGITVESPGSYDYAAGVWNHWGGGHWWFDLPEGFELPAGKVLKGPGGWAAYWGESYILVPPAVRPEGAYRLTGGTSVAPPWLVEQVATYASAKVAEMASRQAQGERGGPIDAWSAATSWASLLEPQGWIETSMAEGSCGCPIWTAPGGDHASPKSATAHDLACIRFDVSEGWGPLKIWTDHPPEGLPPGGAVTKLDYVSRTLYGGDTAAACKGLGIERVVAPAWEVPAEWAAGAHVHPGEPLPPPGQQPTPDPFGIPSGPPPDPSVPQGGLAGPGAEEERPSWADVDLGPFLDGTWRPLEPTMLPRSDGLCLLYPGRTHSIHGESESGKTWVALAECARLVRAGYHVKMIDFESDAGSVSHRMLELNCTPAQLGEFFHYSAPEVKPGSDTLEYAEWERLFRGRFALVVIDGVTDALGLWSLKTTDNDDWTAFNRAFPKRLARETGAAVLMVDHVTKSTDGRGRFAIGGQAKMNTITGAAFVVDVLAPMGRVVRGVLAIGLAKDKGGYLRGRAGAFDRNRIQPLSEFILDASVPSMGLLVAVNTPPEPDGERQEDNTAKIVSYVTQYPGQSQSVIARETGIRPADVIPILRALESSGSLVIERIGQKHAQTLIGPHIDDMSPTPLLTPTSPSVVVTASNHYTTTPPQGA